MAFKPCGMRRWLGAKLGWIHAAAAPLPALDADAVLRLLLARCGRRFSLVDVGARWGINDRWARIGDVVEALCFEPDVQECDRLNAGRPSNVRYLPFGLADGEAVRDFHVTAEPACGSLYPPVAALYEHYPPLAGMTPAHTIRVPCRRLDDVLAAEGIASVDAIKLDTQGAELAILQGATRALATCALVDVEVEFNPLYGGLGLFCDVDRHLRDQGFVRWRLENLVHYAPETVAAARADMMFAAEPAAAVFTSVANGQLFWAQAQYVRAAYPRTGAETLPAEEAIRAAVLAGLYGFWDLSLELVRKTGDADLLRRLRATLIG
jgi:FkbM family methyltransferase